MKNKLLILLTLGLFSCSKKQEQIILTEATYVVFYSDSNIDTLNISTTGRIEESSFRGTNEIAEFKNGYIGKNLIYQNSAPFKRIKFKQTIIK